MKPESAHWRYSERSGRVVAIDSIDVRRVLMHGHYESGTDAKNARRRAKWWERLVARWWSWWHKYKILLLAGWW